MIGQRLRSVREGLGLTVERMAESLAREGYPATAQEVARYEEGEELPGIDFLEAFQRALAAFGVTPALMMERPSLEGLPETAAPAGYGIRPLRPGDAAAWCRLINESIGGGYDEAGFVEYQLVERGMTERSAGNDAFRPEGLLFAECAGQVVGTACAVWRAGRREEKGQVQMVVVDPAHRGRGIGRALLLAVLRELRGRGFRGATLQTDDHRLPAIRLYLSAGFKPVYERGTDRARWAEVFRQLEATRQDEDCR